MPNFIEIARNVAEIWCFLIFQDGGRRHLELLKFRIFNGRARHGTASACQISSKSFEPRPRYASFNIMLVWLENANSRLFWGFWGTFIPNDVTHYPYTQKDYPWAEPRHLSHKPQIFSYQFLNGHYKSLLHVFPLV